MNPIIAQAVGIIAMLFNIFSYQQKSAKRIIAFQFFGFPIHGEASGYPKRQLEKRVLLVGVQRTVIRQ